MFDVREEVFEGPGLALRAHLAPWDRPVLGHETAAISALELRDPALAGPVWTAFCDWCERRAVALVSARLPHRAIAECGFLEARGFRFVELNYRPAASDLARFRADPEIAVAPAGPGDEAAVRAMAGEVFEAGRFHADPQLGPELGDRRYAAWAANAFRSATQAVLTCSLGGRIVAFFVVERPAPDRRFWSLVGLAPGLAGRGLGRRVWGAVLADHAAAGVRGVETSISSHNVPALNLYASLGFRFPEPSITLHWCPRGPLVHGP